MESSSKKKSYLASAEPLDVLGHVPGRRDRHVLRDHQDCLLSGAVVGERCLAWLEDFEVVRQPHQVHHFAHVEEALFFAVDCKRKELLLLVCHTLAYVTRNPAHVFTEFATDNDTKSTTRTCTQNGFLHQRAKCLVPDEQGGVVPNP